MEQLLTLLAGTSFLISVGAVVVVVLLARKLQAAQQQQQLLTTDLDYRLKETQHHLEAVAQHTNAQLQRLTQPIPPAPAPRPEPAVAAAAVPTGTWQSVTERRHRVLTLARRGMDVKAIAQTLGMPHGEVALIIRMSNPKFGD